MVKAQKIDINFRFKRWDSPEVGFLRALIWDAISKRKSWLPIDNILRVIKLLIYSGIDLRIADESETVLIDPILEGDEYFAIFLVRHAPKMALDKMALHFALAMKMPRLVNLMTKRGAMIEIEDIETAECYKELNKAEVNKTQLAKCIVS